MLIQGRQSTNEVTPVLVDSAGRVIVSGNEPAPNNPVGFLAEFTNLNLPAGSSTQIIYTIPANQRMLLTEISVTYYGTIGGVSLFPEVTDNVNTMTLGSITTVVSGVPGVFVVNVLLEAGWKVRCTILGATLNDDFVGRSAFQRYK